MLKRCGVLLLLSFLLFMGKKHIVYQSLGLLNEGCVFVNNPYWVSCNGGDFSFFSKPDITIGNDIIFFLDKSLNYYNNKNRYQTSGLFGTLSMWNRFS